MSPYKTPEKCNGRCPLCVAREDCREELIRIGNMAEALEQDDWEESLRDWESEHDLSSIDREDSDLGNER